MATQTEELCYYCSQNEHNKEGWTCKCPCHNEENE